MRNFYLYRSLCFLLPLLTLGCLNKNVVATAEASTIQEIKSEQQYLRWIGDIEHDFTRDYDSFRLCNGDDKIIQYFHAGKGPAVHIGEKPALLRKFKNEYQPPKDNSHSGLIRIRFIVNCEGQAGRFRVLQSDFDYHAIEFEESIVSQLLNITKSVEHWEILSNDGKAADYYFYLIFQINNGHITEILP